jgi:hypothetical protein
VGLLNMKDYKNKDLRGKDFSNQNLKDADFSGANLIGANFSGSCLDGCNFKNAKGAKNLPCEKGKYGIIKLPNGLIAVGCLHKTPEDWLALSFKDCQKLYADITKDIWNSIRSAIIDG